MSFTYFIGYYLNKNKDVDVGFYKEETEILSRCQIGFSCCNSKYKQLKDS